MRNTKKGFTLVELLVVIAILAILATVSVVGYTSFINRANESNLATEAHQVKELINSALLVDGSTVKITNDVIIKKGADGKYELAAGVTEPTYSLVNDLAGMKGEVSFVGGQVIYSNYGLKYNIGEGVIANENYFGSLFPMELENGADFLDAVKDIEDNGTISLKNDITITGSNGGDLNGTGKTTNINLNGNTATASTGNAGFGIRNNAVANITGGTVMADANTYTAILSRYDGAVANVSNMTLGNSKENGTALCARDNGIINVENTVINSTIGGCADANAGTINVKNCTFNQTGTDTDYRSTLFLACFSGTINIEGGTYIGENKGLYIITSGGTFNVYSGTFKAKEVIKADMTNYENSYPGATATFNIYGGSFEGAIVVNGTDANVINIHSGTFTNTGINEDQFEKYVAQGSEYSYDTATDTFTVTVTK